jgi:hypothetical protein
VLKILYLLFLHRMSTKHCSQLNIPMVFYFSVFPKQTTEPGNEALWWWSQPGFPAFVGLLPGS